MRKNQEKIIKEIAKSAQKEETIKINEKTRQRLIQLQFQVNAINNEMGTILKTILELNNTPETDQYSISNDFSVMTLVKKDEDKKESKS